MPKRWDARSLPTNAAGSRPHRLRRRRCTWGWTALGVPVRRSEVEGRCGKQPDGVAKTREVKLVTMDGGTRDKDGLPRSLPAGESATTPRSRLRPAAPPPPLPSAFAQRAYREARWRGFDTAPRRVVLGDGTNWIWNLAAEGLSGRF